MSDTSQMAFPSSANEMKRLSTQLDELEGRFREQRVLLAKQGMALPAGLLANLQTVKTELDTLYKEFEERNTELERLRALSKTTELINSSLELEEVLNEVIDTVISLTKAERGYLMLRDANTNQLQVRVARNTGHRALADDEFIVSQSVVAEVVNSGRPIYTLNAGTDPRFAEQKSIVGFALLSIMCVPLIVKEQVTGVIYTDNSVRMGIFGERETNMLQAFANQAAVAIENARLFEAVRAQLNELITMRDLMQNVFTSIASGVLSIDKNEQILQLNAAASRILGLDSQACIGHNFYSALSFESSNVRQAIRQVMTEQGERFVELYTPIGVRPDVTLTFKISPLLGSNDKIDGVTIVVDDLTEIKQREAQLTVVRRYLTPAMVDNISSIEKLGLGGERHEVTVLYVDVRSFATFPADMKPGEMLSLLNQYLTLAADEITQYNGVIDKYMGNVIMALFNTQLNLHDDHVWLALQAALKIADSFEQAYRFHAEPDGMRYFRLGLNTGVATLGNVGSESRREFTAIGDTINVGHRLLENARLGDIMISQATADGCWNQLMDLRDQGKIAFGEQEQLSVKGRTEHVLSYRLRRLSHHTGHI